MTWCGLVHAGRTSADQPECQSVKNFEALIKKRPYLACADDTQPYLACMHGPSECIPNLWRSYDLCEFRQYSADAPVEEENVAFKLEADFIAARPSS